MICSESTLQRLEYPRLRTLLAGQTQSEPGKLRAEHLLPLSEQAAVEIALTEVDEALEWLSDGQSPGLGGCRNLTEILVSVRAEGSLLAADDLLKVTQSLQAMRDCSDFFRRDERQGLLLKLAAEIVPLSELQRRLRESIDPHGDLLDSASFELGDLRYQIRQTRSRVKQQLNQLLSGEHSSGLFQEQLITVRNNRYVVPLRSDCRGQVKGFIQDESASGQTLYIEPSQVLDGNNRLQQLSREEQREERRILLQLAELVRRDADVLQNNQRLLARIDLRFAAARLSRNYHGCRPELVDESLIELKQARHPLLMETDGQFDSAAAVEIDLLLDENCRVLVISGPNTGGKSVALKTLGLLLLMVRSGLHIPCHSDSRLHLYHHLFVDIGDEQSIEQSLSTFSGHLLKIREILEHADNETLVLLDEAGTGTDPAEGAALIQAVLDQLCQQGAKTVLTTHLGQLKHFAHSHPDIENAAVEFDPETLAPTYRLRYGIPGASSALTTAKRLGLPQAVIDGAIEYLGREEHDYSTLLARLNQRQQELDLELQQIKGARIEADAARQLRKQQLEALQEKKREILQRATRQGEELIAATEARLKKLRKRKPGTVSPQQTVADRHELNLAREELTPFRPKQKLSNAVPIGLNVGEIVRIAALGVEAEVERLDGKMVDLQVAGKRMRQPLNALEQFSPRRFVNRSTEVSAVSRNMIDRQIGTKLKLVGLRVDDALAKLERFIDDAVLHHLPQVEIIHGAGQGILRRAVREKLATETAVTAFYAAPADQGGDNITIAELSSG
jgi:DNA mismatch repair protein MutS2